METANKTYVLMNENELQAWVQCRIDGGVKYSVEKDDLGGVSRATKLTDDYGKEFCLDWKLVGYTEYVERLLPEIKKVITQNLGVLADVYGCEGFFFGFKIPHVGIDNELEMGYGLYTENMKPEDVDSLRFNYEQQMLEVLTANDLVSRETLIFDIS